MNLVSHTEAVAMTLLGIDWGARRIGVAIKPSGLDWALPRITLWVEDEADSIWQIRQMIQKDKIDGVVIGLPINPDPAQEHCIKRWTRKVRAPLSGIRWFFIDEQLTTFAADELAHEAEIGQEKPSDDLAAALILESFLNACKARHV